MNEAGWALPAVAAARPTFAVPEQSFQQKPPADKHLIALNSAAACLSISYARAASAVPSCASRAATKLQNTRLTASGLTHIWRLTAADAASFEGSAFVSCLFLVGTTDARNQSNRGRKRVGSLTLSV